MEGHHKTKLKKKMQKKIQKKKLVFFRIHPVGQPAFPALWGTLIFCYVYGVYKLHFELFTQFRLMFMKLCLSLLKVFVGF